MKFSLTWLPDVLLDAGLKVALVPGWEERGRGNVGDIAGVICHHTVGRRQGNMPSLDVLRDGRGDLKGPLSQLGLARDGTYFVIAAGRANHAGKGDWLGQKKGNTSFIGIEAENTGGADDFPWPEVQMDAYVRGVAAILKKIGKTAQFCCGHKEYALPAGRKPDPSFDMILFRERVAAILGIPSVEPTGKKRPTLQRGAKDPLVIEIQRKLDVPPPHAANFGPKTEAAVRAFQRDRGMIPDGIVGPKTWLELDKLQ